MSKIGRITGHGLAVFFILLGAGFVAASLSGAAGWLDENSTCTYGDNCSDSAPTVFLFLGMTFIVAGVFTSVVTEFAIRKAQRLFVSVSKLSSGDAAGVEGLADFLEPFGIDLDAAGAAGADGNVQQGVIDLRGQRQGAVPTDPASLNEYLKGFGINLGEESLRNATVVTAGEPMAHARAEFAAGEAPPTASPESPRERESARIIRKKDRGETAGGQRLVEFELEVQPVGRVPYRVEVASLVRESLVSLLIEGSTLNVRVDPANRNSVTIDWSEN
jgi:hypothetical protein